MLTIALDTPIGPLAVITSGGSVLAAGFTRDEQALLALVHPDLRPPVGGARCSGQGAGANGSAGADSGANGGAGADSGADAASGPALPSPIANSRSAPGDPPRSGPPRRARATRRRSSCRATEWYGPVAVSVVTAGGLTSNGSYWHVSVK
jgi:hypothetical protein